MTSASSLRLAHVADLHIGAGYAHGDDEKGGVNSRLVDFRTAWVLSCEDMVAYEVDLVLFAGDAFRDCRPSPTEQAAFRAGLDVLANANITVIMVPGNHDLPRAVGRTNALDIFSGYRGRVHVFTRPEVVTTNGMAVACFPYPMRAHLAAADPEFEKLTLDEQNQRMTQLSLQVLRSLGAEAEKMAAPFGSVLIAHGTIAGSAIGAEGSTAFLREAVLPLPELRGLPFRYQAWGHLHRAQECGDARIQYSGSIERCDFAEADEDKGWWAIDLPAGKPEISFVNWHSSAPRPFVDLKLDNPSEWELEVEPVDEAVVRVSYTATPEAAKTVDHNAIRRALSAAGAAKVHGPYATILHTVTAKSDSLSEETDSWTAYEGWKTLQGINGSQGARLDPQVREAMEVTA